MRTTSLLFLALAAAAFATRATAATLNVPGNGLTTIQDGVDAAGPGDTIKVKAGTYVENVVIPAGKDGLRLIAGGKVTLDARPQGAIGTGPGILIGSANVRIVGFTIRHPSGTDGHGVFSTASPGLTLRKLLIQHANERGIAVVGAGITVDGCIVEDCDGGIVIAGDGATVKDTRLRQDGELGMEITGAGAGVVHCRVETVEDGGGIAVIGPNASILSCVVEDTGGNAFQVVGDAFIIRKNRCSGVDGGASGIDVASATSGTIENNRILDTGGSGITLNGNASGLLVRHNVVQRCGYDSSPGIRVDGAGSILEDNVVARGSNDGFRAAGSSNTFSGNVARENGGDGFQVAGTGNALTGNKARKNLAEGFENNGSATTFEGNQASGNRIDVASDGSFATFTNNTFQSGGATTPPEIDA